MFQFSSLSVLSLSATTYKIQRKMLSVTLKGGNLTCVKPHFNFDNVIELYECENKNEQHFCVLLLGWRFYRTVFTCKPFHI